MNLWELALSSGNRTRHNRYSRSHLAVERLEPRHVLSTGGLFITEFMAANDSAWADGDGSYSDWIEVYNSDQADTDLGNYFLTDNATILDKWAFPDRILPHGEYLVVFASAPDDGMGGIQDRYIDAGGFYHTNFKLDADGEYLALVYQDPTTHALSIVQEFGPEFPAQQADISYGIGQFNQTLAGPGTPVGYLAPTDGSLGTAWTMPEFDDSAWTDTIWGSVMKRIRPPAARARN